MSASFVTARTAFYYCPELHCGLYYRPRLPDSRPVLSCMVNVPSLKTKVRIEYVGRGVEAYQKLVDKKLEEYTFPVDLCNLPWQIDPFPSRTVTDQMLTNWESLCVEYSIDKRHP